MPGNVLNDGQLAAELRKCMYCPSRGCEKACPAGCSPHDFIMAAIEGTPADLGRAAAMIMRMNPLGGVCGAVCPDSHCMAGCARSLLDQPVNIPAVQATIIAKARAAGVLPVPERAPATGKRVAIVGAGPAGLTAAAVLGQLGHAVTMIEAREQLGGSAKLIPGARLPGSMLDADINDIIASPNVTVELGKRVEDPKTLLDSYDAVLVTAGCMAPRPQKCPGEEAAVSSIDYLTNPEKFNLGRSVAVIGGGAVAVDCAVTAKRQGADEVRIVYRRGMADMPLTCAERREIIEHGIEVVSRTVVTGVEATDGKIEGLRTKRVTMGNRAEGAAAKDVPNSDYLWNDVTGVVFAIGLTPSIPVPTEDVEGIFFAGDFIYGASTVVEAVAHAKEMASRVNSFLTGAAAGCPRRVAPTSTFGKVRSVVPINGYNDRPVSLETNFFDNKRIPNPFILSASPLTDGIDECRAGLQAGWGGVVLKTAFDGIPVHIPNEYMYNQNGRTYGNCDNVSGHSLDRMIKEIAQLKLEFPDRAIIASTGGPVTGDREHDRAGWQANTRKAESCQPDAVEYSLSCPQGGDGSEGAIVSQNADLTAEIIDYVLEIGDANIPHIFKLTAAVASVRKILSAVKVVFEKYPHKKAAVTLANSFPAADNVPAARANRVWEDFRCVGIHGEGVTPISMLSLASVWDMGINISGNGGPMNYKAAADFLALGCKNVQFCTAPERLGVDWISELCSGVSHLLAARGIGSVDELIGAACRAEGRPQDPIIDFMEMTPKKRIPVLVRPDDCIGCGTCTNCPYLAVSLENGKPTFDPARCHACGFCWLTCRSSVTGCIEMRDRTPEETAVFHED